MKFLSAALLLVALALASAENLCKENFIAAGASVSKLCPDLKQKKYTMQDIADCKTNYTLTLMDAVKKCADQEKFKNNHLETMDGLVDALCDRGQDFSTEVSCCIMSQESMGTNYENKPEDVTKICQKCVTDPKGTGNVP